MSYKFDDDIDGRHASRLSMPTWSVGDNWDNWDRLTHLRATLPIAWGRRSEDIIYNKNVENDEI